MKTVNLLLFFLLTSLTTAAQETTFNVYNPQADAALNIEKAVTLAKSTNKHVLLQIGGNWCKWCRLFYKWSHETSAIDSILKSDFVVEHINYSPENKNKEVLKKLEFPQRFGFPVFVILDGNGNLLHTQNTAYLETETGYSDKKVAEFLKHWNFSSLEAEQYEK